MYLILLAALAGQQSGDAIPLRGAIPLVVAAARGEVRARKTDRAVIDAESFRRLAQAGAISASGWTELKTSLDSIGRIGASCRSADGQCMVITALTIGGDHQGGRNDLLIMVEVKYSAPVTIAGEAFTSIRTIHRVSKLGGQLRVIRASTP